MKFIFEVDSVDFDFFDGFGRLDNFQLEDSCASAIYNESFMKKNPKIIDAYNESEARRALSLEIERETGWNVKRVRAEIVRVEQ